jgi:hypothetical protein
MKSKFVVTNVLVACGLLFFQPALAADPPSPREICEQALPHLMLGKAEGFEVLARFNTSDTKTSDPASVAAAYEAHANQIQRWAESKGRALGFELVEEKRVNDTISRCVYICKFERGFMRWVFKFYRPEGRWFVLAYHFDENFDALLP